MQIDSEHRNSGFVGPVFCGLARRGKRVGVPHWVERRCQPQGAACASNVGILASGAFGLIQGFSILTGEVCNSLS